MSSWVVVPSLLSLREEFNRLSPSRDKGADGTIGDTAHTSSSDHTPDEESRVLEDHDGDSKNEVHALDIDSSGPWPGEGSQKERFHRIVMRVISGEKAKWNSATDRCRLNYVIWDGRIYDKDDDFAGRYYSGSDRHTNHAHFSNRYETGCENDTRPWGVFVPQPIEEPDVELTTEMTLTDATADALGKPRGTKMQYNNFLQTVAIQAARGAINGDAAKDAAVEAKSAAQTASSKAQTAVDQLGSIDGRLGTVEDWINEIGDPSTDLSQVSQTLKALWGVERARALGLLLSA